MSTSALIPLDIHVPGGREEPFSVEGVSRRGEVVGTYGAGVDDHAFVESGGVTKRLQVPGSTHTYVGGVTADGEIYGDYSVNDGSYGFLDNGGVFTTVQFPSTSDYTGISGVTAAGVIFGSDGAGTQFVDNDGAYTQVGYNSAASGSPEIDGVNATGEIAGIFWDGANSTVFTDTDGSVQLLSNIATAYTTVAGISNNGEIAGTTGFQDSRAFVYSDGAVSYLFPHAQYSEVAGITASGEIVGNLTTQGGKSEGFIDENGIVHRVSLQFYIRGVTNSGQLYGSDAEQHYFMTAPHFV
jgi:hypothetical protein